MEIRSIWDGWKHQCFYRLRDGDARCAAGYLPESTWYADAQLHRIAEYIKAHYPMKEGPYQGGGTTYVPNFAIPIHVIVYANNYLKLTPEQFREADRRSQVEAAVKPLIESVDVSEERESPCLQK